MIPSCVSMLTFQFWSNCVNSVILYMSVHLYLNWGMTPVLLKPEFLDQFVSVVTQLNMLNFLHHHSTYPQLHCNNLWTWPFLWYYITFPLLAIHYLVWNSPAILSRECRWIFFKVQGKNRTPSANDMDSLRPIQRSQSHDFVRYTLKTTDIPLDVRYKGLVGGKIPLCHNIFKGEPLDNEWLIRKSFCASIRSAIKTTNIPSDVTYNVLVGC